MSDPKESIAQYFDPASSVEDALIPNSRDVTLEEGSAIPDQEKVVEHIMMLLRQVISAFREGKES